MHSPILNYETRFTISAINWSGKPAKEISQSSNRLPSTNTCFYKCRINTTIYNIEVDADGKRYQHLRCSRVP